MLSAFPLCCSRPNPAKKQMKAFEAISINNMCVFVKTFLLHFQGNFTLWGSFLWRNNAKRSSVHKFAEPRKKKTQNNFHLYIYLYEVMVACGCVQANCMEFLFEILLRLFQGAHCSLHIIIAGIRSLNIIFVDRWWTITMSW